MAKVFIEETTLTSIGDAIREKGNTTELINPLNMADAITNLPSGGGELSYYLVNYSGGASKKLIFNLSEVISAENPVPFLAILPFGANSSTSASIATQYPLVIYYNGVDTALTAIWAPKDNPNSASYYYMNASYTDQTLTVNFSKIIYNGSYTPTHTANIIYLKN